MIMIIINKKIYFSDIFSPISDIVTVCTNGYLSTYKTILYCFIYATMLICSVFENPDESIDFEEPIILFAKIKVLATFLFCLS